MQMQTDRPIHRISKCKYSVRQKKGQADRHGGRQTDMAAGRQTWRQADRHGGRQTDRRTIRTDSVVPGGYDVERPAFEVGDRHRVVLQGGHLDVHPPFLVCLQAQKHPHTRAAAMETQSKGN